MKTTINPPLYTWSEKALIAVNRERDRLLNMVGGLSGEGWNMYGDRIARNLALNSAVKVWALNRIVIAAKRG